MLFVTKSWMPIWSGLKDFWVGFLLPFSWRVGFWVVGSCDRGVVLVVSWFIFDIGVGLGIGGLVGFVYSSTGFISFLSFFFYMQL